MPDDENKAAEPSIREARRKKRGRSRSRNRARNRSQEKPSPAQQGRAAKSDSPPARIDRGRAKDRPGPSRKMATPQAGSPAERRPPPRNRPAPKGAARPARSEPQREDWREPEDRPANAARRSGLRLGDSAEQSEDQREPAGAAFFRSFEHYDQEEAREWLSEPNIKLIQQANPEPGQWAYCALVKDRCPAREIEQVKRALPIPSDVYAVLIDSGLSLRALITGTPMYERLLEFNFIDEASFDCWIQGEWVCEAVFDDKAELLRRAVMLLEEYLHKDIVSNEAIVQAPRPDGALPPARTEW